MPGSELVSWLLLVTKGTGPVWSEEHLISVEDKPRLVWLGYELVRHPVRGRTSWTWRRPKAQMEELYALLAEQLNRHIQKAVGETLNRTCRQPGFAGVREQSRALCEYALHHGFKGELPHLFYLQKLPHGERLVI